MSRTHKDKPIHVQRAQGIDLDRGYTFTSAPRWYVQMFFNRPERHRAKRDLAEGVEPYPHQPRRRASWDYW